MEIFDNKRFMKTGKFISSAGKKIDEYYDFIEGLVDFNFMNRRIRSYILKNIILKANFIGIETCGLAIATFLLGMYGREPIYLGEKFVLNKKQINILLFLKKRTNRKKIYGKIDNKWKTYIIDDVITTGKTIKEALNVLKEKNIKVDKIMCLLNRSKLKEINEIEIIEI